MKWHKQRQARDTYLVDLTSALGEEGMLLTADVRVEQLHRGSWQSRTEEVLKGEPVMDGHQVRFVLAEAEGDQQPAGNYRVLVTAETTDDQILAVPVHLQILA